MERIRRALTVCCLLATIVEPADSAAETAESALSPKQLLLLTAADDLAAELVETIWPGWGGSEMELLLVAGEREYLVGSSRQPEGFESLGPVAGLGAVAVRERLFPPTLLATMPVFGPPPTIVVGTPEATERGSTAWLQVLMHEHFHQWQMRSDEYFLATEALDLADGDTTGRWMLEFPFPYDDPETIQAFGELSTELAALLRRPVADDLTTGANELWREFDRFVGRLPPRSARYLDFQLWQEGVARFVELRVAEEAALRWRPPAELAALPDFESFSRVAGAAHEALLEELETPDLQGRRRVAFYALGAGMALLLERTEPQWKHRYETPRFALAPRPPLD